MTRHLFWALIFLAITGCNGPDEEIIIPSREVVDTGIYDLDDVESGGENSSSLFCSPVPVDNGFSCWDLAVDVSISCHYDSLFNRYGDGWTGADATYSTTLPDGRRFWLFGDTFLGTVNPDGSRPGGNPLINNSVVIEKGKSFKTLHGGTKEAPRAFLEPSNAEHWYWPNDPTVYGNELHVLLSRMGRSGTGGMWDFHLVSTDLAIFSLPDLELISLEVKEPGDDVYWGAAVMRMMSTHISTGLRMKASINLFQLRVRRMATYPGTGSFLTAQLGRMSQTGTLSATELRISLAYLNLRVHII